MPARISRKPLTYGAAMLLVSALALGAEVQCSEADAQRVSLASLQAQIDALQSQVDTLEQESLGFQALTTVWVDAEGNIVGTALDSDEVVIQTSSGLVAAVVSKDGNPDVFSRLWGRPTAYFLTGDCSGPAYFERRQDLQPIGPGNVQLTLDAAGDLHSYDVSAPLTPINPLSRLNHSDCGSSGGSYEMHEATLLEADFLGQFTLPLHLEQLDLNWASVGMLMSE